MEKQKLASVPLRQNFKQHLRGRAAHCMAAAVLSFSLASCAVTIPPAIATSQGAVTGLQTIEFAELENAGSQRAAFGAALRHAFEVAAIPMGSPPSEEESPEGLIADFALSERPASEGIADPEASTDDLIVWVSPPRDRRLFDACDARRLRATLILLDRRDNTLVYRGVAEATECAFDEEHFAQMADALVSDALARP